MTNLFQSVDEWIFDLDNTLYPRDADLFSQIDWKMTDFVERLTGLPRDEARKLQKDLYRDHGTTLNGLMNEYDIDPHAYLEAVHDIDYSPLSPHPELARIIKQLPGRKHIFTNGDVPHAEKTLQALGFEPFFDSMFDIVAADFSPKPHRRAYERFLAQHVVHPECAAMFEDMPRNLSVPKTMGMRTVLVVPSAISSHKGEAWEVPASGDGHIDAVTDDLERFLANVLKLLQKENATE